MELRSRSRSKTPFQTESFLQAESFTGSNHVTVTRTTRRSTLRSGESYETKPIKTKSTKLRSIYKTSDYSSEEGETETHISENEKNQIIEDAIAAANGSAEVSALNLYRKAGRYWDKYPKTDYTYSRHSRDRVEIAPGVVQMPNMSRRTIHSDSSTNTDTSYTTKSLIKQRLFSSPNNNDEIDESYKIYRSSTSTQQRNILTSITTIFLSFVSMISWCFLTIYRGTNSTMIYFGKKLHHLASRVMLLDTWLLKKSTSQKKTKAVVALCLLPLLFFAAWFLLSSLGSAIYWSLLNPSNDSVPLETQIKSSLILDDLPQTSSDLPPEANLQLNTDEIIDRVLKNPKLSNIIENYHNDLRMGIESNEKLHQIIAELKTEINKNKNDLLVMDRLISQIRVDNIRALTRLNQRLNRCCNKQIIDLEPYVIKAFGNLLNNPEFLSNQDGLINWLHGIFIAKQYLEGHLSNVTETLNKNFDNSIENTANQVMEKVINRLSFDSTTINEEQIKKIVHSVLRIYDADKTGLVDYAMEPLGGEIITTRCTESYHSGSVISILGIPVWYPSISPRTVITPGINPGECWAFQNFPGFLVIKLATKIKINAFSIEHVSRLLVPDGKIDSAPKEFEIYGLETENDKDPVKIGDYIYDYDGESLQFFTAQTPDFIFNMIELRIKSNHGNPNYTCLYRFRVHGNIV